jgi:cell division protein ZapA (FtsZ GTPase activity inhibitor)
MMDITEILTNVSLGIGIAVPLFGGVWFLMARTNSSGANSKKLDVLTGAVQELQTMITDFRTELKEDVSKLDIKIDNVRAELKKDIADLRSELKDDIRKLDIKIDNVRTELKEDISKLDVKIDNVRTELKKDIADLRTELKMAKYYFEVLRFYAKYFFKRK